MIEYIAANWMLIVGGLFLGVCSGILTGLFGAGGGFIITPALNIFLHLPYNFAIGTSTCQILGASGLTLYRRAKAVAASLKVAIFISIGIPLGSFTGVKVVSNMKDMGKIEIAGKLLNAQDFYFTAFFCVFLLIIAAWLFFDNFYLRRHVSEEEDDDKGYLAWIKIPPMVNFPSIPHGPFSVTVLIIIGICVGFLSGLLGIGGGVIIMPILFYLVGQETKYATLTSTILVFFSSLISSILHGIHGNINYILVIFLVAGAFVGTRIGVFLHHKITGKSIRKYFAFVVLTAVIMVGIKLISMVTKS